MSGSSPLMLCQMTTTCSLVDLSTTADPVSKVPFEFGVKSDNIESNLSNPMLSDPVGDYDCRNSGGLGESDAQICG
uniref:Uncharacterized protein n=1 Tax=Romanomermis culicivorax TaxID=13658 RepID=A0A915JDE9_ROMCU